MEEPAKRIRLGDGRILGFAQWGEPDGTPVVHMHGSSSSRLERPPDLADLESLGVRLITVDRPGHGLSDHDTDGDPRSCAADVRALIDALGLRQIVLTAWSMGGPFALACARAFPERVSALGLVSSIAPPDAPDALDAPMSWRTRLGLRFHGWSMRQNPAGAMRRVRKSLPAPDQDVLDDHGVLRVLVPAMREAFRQGSRGPLSERQRVAEPWGFTLGKIRVPVHMWQGEDDENVPRQAAEHLHHQISGSDVTFLPNAGHFHIFRNWKQILATTLDTARAQATR